MRTIFRVAMTFALLGVSIADAQTLADLMSGGSLTVGDKVFDHFSWSSASGIDPSGISVTTIGDGSADNLYGIKLDFKGNFITAGGVVDGDLIYAVHTTGGQLISDLHSTVNADGIGTVDVNEVASDQAGQGASSYVIPLTVIGDITGPTRLSGSIEIPLSGTVWINKDIMFFGSGRINDVEQQFSQVPDGASTLALLALALAGLQTVRRRLCGSATA